MNHAKTKFMMIRTPYAYDDFSDCALTCKGEHIELVQHSKYLSILNFIDENLNFRHQVEYVVDSALRKVGTFQHGCRNLATEATRTLYLSICQATLDYASNANVHCLSNNLHNRLGIASHLCMTKVFGFARSILTHLMLSRYNL